MIKYMCIGNSISGHRSAELIDIGDPSEHLPVREDIGEGTYNTINDDD